MASFFLYGPIIFVSSAIITRVMISLGILDRLTKRSLHTRPTPRAGGVSVVLTYILSMVALYSYKPEIFVMYSSKQLYVIVWALIAVAIISFFDDISPIHYIYRLLLQVICAISLAQCGVCISKLWLPYWGYVQLGICGPLLTVIWFVAFMNIFNFMDGADGLVGGCSIIACVFLAAISCNSKDYLDFYSFAVMVPAVAGFFIFNFPKAKIFMGDVGSHFLGFLFALHEINMQIHNASNISCSNFIPGFTTVVVMGNFVFEVVFTLTRRIAAGKSIVLPHNEFLFHILLRCGWSHIRISLLHFGFVLFQGMLVYFSNSKTALMFSAVVVILIQSVYAYRVLNKQKKIADAAA